MLLYYPTFSIKYNRAKTENPISLRKPNNLACLFLAYQLFQVKLFHKKTNLNLKVT
jgi:hypothetical protein